MDVFSTGDVAKVTRSSIQMVIRWIDQGMLKGWKVPGSRFRRVSRSDLRRFMIAHNIPLDLLDQSESVILLVSSDSALRSTAASLTVGEIKIRCAEIFEAGMLFKSLAPLAVVVDCELSSDSVHRVVDAVRAESSAKPIVAIARRDGTGIDSLPCVQRAEMSNGLSVILQPLLEID